MNNKNKCDCNMKKRNKNPIQIIGCEKYIWISYEVVDFKKILCYNQLWKENADVWKS